MTETPKYKEHVFFSLLAPFVRSMLQEHEEGDFPRLDDISDKVLDALLEKMARHEHMPINLDGSVNLFAIEEAQDFWQLTEEN